MADFYRVQFRSVPSQLEDTISGLCFDFGSSGVAQNLEFYQPDLVYDPYTIDREHVDFDAFFLESPADVFFEELRTQYPGVKYTVSQEAPQDWLSEWKKGFKSFCLIDRYWVVPSWLEVPSGDIVPISMDPGMAFGTGTHTTTQVAAQLIFQTCQEAELGSVLDVGTGTGILALLSTHLGASKVVAIDNDPEALRVARENIEVNSRLSEGQTREKVLSIEVPDTSLTRVSDTFDVVVANIIDGVLLKLRDDLIRVVKPGGTLILCGILRERAEEFISQFVSPEELAISHRIERDEWVGLLLKRIDQDGLNSKQ